MLFNLAVCPLDRKQVAWVVALLFIFSICEAQPGSEWVEYGQHYSKISVAQTGLQQVSGSVLQDNGFPIGVSSSSLQLYHDGQEVAIKVLDGGDGIFNATDQLLFFGFKANGKSDAGLFQSPDKQGNPQVNLFDDNAYYFLTSNPNAISSKRIATSISSISPSIPKVDRFYLEKVVEERGSFFAGPEIISNYGSQSFFDEGEGWGSNLSTKTYTFTARSVDADPSMPLVFESRLCGKNGETETISLESKDNTGAWQEVNTYTVAPRKVVQIIDSIPYASNSSTAEVRLRASLANNSFLYFGKALIPCRNIPSNDQEGHLIAHQASVAPQVNYELNGVSQDYSVFDVSNPNQPIEIQVIRQGNNLSFSLDSATQNRKIWVASNAIITTITTNQLAEVTFSPLPNDSADLLILTHPNLLQGAAEYAAYRDSMGISSAIVDITQIYNQLGNGNLSPLPVKNYFKHMHETNGSKHVFIIGKGLHYTDVRIDPNWMPAHLVPTFGFPGSDLLYTSEPFTTSEPFMGIGRISALENDNVRDYLAKVREFEHKELDAPWRKRALMMSGGRSEAEIRLFTNTIQRYAETAESGVLGANVEMQHKQSTSPTEVFDVTKQINNGVSVVSILGHSSAVVLDVDIGYASAPTFNYQNKGKYPFIFINGCSSGDIFSRITPRPFISLIIEYGALMDNWILTPEKGAIAFGSNCEEGFTSTLDRFSTILFDLLYQDTTFVAKPFGDIYKETIKRFLGSSGINNRINASHAYQWIYSGDPYLKLFQVNKPDLKIKTNSLQVSDLTKSDSISLSFTIQNTGIIHEEKTEVSINRSYPNSSIQYPIRILPAFGSEQEVLVKLPVSASGNELGQNTIEVTIDPFNEVEEANEENNSSSLSFYYAGSAPQPIHPSEFSIVSSKEIKLKALARNNGQRSSTVEFELDTSIFFNSPLKIKKQSTSNVLVEQDFTLPYLQDSTVYFWRVRYPDGGNSWASSSFVYIDQASSGWAQSHFFQFEQNSKDNISSSTFTRKYSLPINTLDIDLRTAGAGLVDPGSDDIADEAKISLNGIEYVNMNELTLCPVQSLRPTNLNTFWTDSGSNPPPGVYVFCVDFNSVNPYGWINQNGEAPFDDNYGCGISPYKIIYYRKNFFDNRILSNPYEPASTDFPLQEVYRRMKPKDYLVFMTAGSIDYSSWFNNPTIASDSVHGLTQPSVTIAQLGGDTNKIKNLNLGEPYMFIGQKPDTSNSSFVPFVLDKTSDYFSTTAPEDQRIQLRHQFVGESEFGALTTPRIGPAKTWGSIVHVPRFADTSNESYILELSVLDTENNRSVLVDTIPIGEFDLSWLDPAEFPLIQLRMILKDQADDLPAQPDWLQVNYQPLPEGVLRLADSSLNDNLNQISLWQGEKRNLALEFLSIGETAFEDSIPIEISYLNPQGEEIHSSQLSIPALGAGNEQASFELPLYFEGAEGIIDVLVKVNPEILPEQDYSNNSFRLTYLVKREFLNPLISVAFDGRRIYDGETVNKQPSIDISIWDENEFLVKDDTLGIQITITKLCQNDSCLPIPYFFANGSLPNNPYQIDYSYSPSGSNFDISLLPEQFEPGLYVLTLQAQDASGNLAGNNLFQISFEVKQGLAMTHVYPVPNPMNGSCRFAFTLEGEQIPSSVTIEIYSLTGVKLKTVTSEQLEPFYIGRNLSNYEWNGTDDSGKLLPNGMYLFRYEVTHNENQRIDHIPSEVDPLFEQGFGKIYLLR